MATDDRSALARFVCHGCGKCCRRPGFVRITRFEAEIISEFLGIGPAEFIERYTRPPEVAEHAGDLWLRDRDTDAHECIFLEDDCCLIHPVKPQHCRDFPERWRSRNILDYCRGMQPDLM